MSCSAKSPAVLLLLFGAALLRVASAADQPQWGERYSRNQITTETGLPDSFDPDSGRNLKWVAELGTSTYSTPVVGGGCVLIGTNNGDPRDPRRKGDRGVMMCFDERDGRLLWQLVVPKRSEDAFLDWPNTGITGAATVEGDRVYLVNNRNEVMCLDLHGLANGNDGPFTDEARHAEPAGAPPVELGPLDADVLWLFNTPVELGVHNHDSACNSPLICGDFLYVATGNGVDRTHRKILAPDAPSLLVLNKHTGRLVAVDGERMGPRTIHSSWSSPSAGEVNGRTLVFFGGGDGVVYAFAAVKSEGVEAPAKPFMLKKVWWFDCDPTAPKENVHAWQDNFKEGPSNISGMTVFHQNRVYVTAGGDVWHGKPHAWLKCIDATRAGDVTRSGEIWAFPLNGHCLATPAIKDGLVYVTDLSGEINCVDDRTGRLVWKHKAGGEIWSSPLVAGDKLFVGTQQGELLTLAAGREKKLIATSEVPGAINATPVAANGTLFVASMGRLYAIKP
jgi:outer membrane protein assembly factor BamB